MYATAMRGTILALAQPGPGYGRGPGMTGGIDALGLTPEQQQKVLAIQEENRRKNWDAMGKMRAEQFRLRSLHHVDPKAFACNVAHSHCR